MGRLLYGCRRCGRRAGTRIGPICAADVRSDGRIGLFFVACRGFRKSHPRCRACPLRRRQDVREPQKLAKTNRIPGGTRRPGISELAIPRCHVPDFVAIIAGFEARSIFGRVFEEVRARSKRRRSSSAQAILRRQSASKYTGTRARLRVVRSIFRIISTLLRSWAIASKSSI